MFWNEPISNPHTWHDEPGAYQITSGDSQPRRPPPPGDSLEVDILPNNCTTKEMCI